MAELVSKAIAGWILALILDRSRLSSDVADRQTFNALFGKANTEGRNALFYLRRYYERTD